MKVSGFDDTIAWYDQNAAQYAWANGRIADVDQIDELADLLPLKAKVLDAGCAAGRDARLFLERGFTVTGVDVSKGLLAIARESVPGVTFIEASFLELPFEDESFDGVWAHQSLLHLETQADVMTALAEFYRVLRKGGRLLVLVKAQTGTEKTAVVSDALSGHDPFFSTLRSKRCGICLSKPVLRLINSNSIARSIRTLTAVPKSHSYTR